MRRQTALSPNSSVPSGVTLVGLMEVSGVDDILVFAIN